MLVNEASIHELHRCHGAFAARSSKVAYGSFATVRADLGGTFLAEQGKQGGALPLYSRRAFCRSRAPHQRSSSSERTIQTHLFS